MYLASRIQAEGEFYLLPTYSSSSYRVVKRALDVLIAAAGLILLSPLLIAIAICVRLGSVGPALYAANRLGKGGRHFQLFKFRSMKSASEPGARVTVSGDQRVTALGKVLRAYKLDELPQLWNVLRGDMSLIGPRPEDPHYEGFFVGDFRRVLACRPGITGAAAVWFRNEELVLAQRMHESNGSAEEVYREILSEKLALELQYLEALSLQADFRIACQTIRAIFKR
jgi:lipopolysaccharide/colanic/teichoic acid biosynthesis glycosyltransferase